MENAGTAIPGLKYFVVAMLVGIIFLSQAFSENLPIANPRSLGSPADTIVPGLRILSWNIYMLPKFAKITGKRQRAALIASLLKTEQYDIIVFQEAFLGDARRIIGNALIDKYPHQYGPANRKFSIKTNSGIWVLSRIPLKVIAEIDYTECDGFDDCFARKGALLLEGEGGRRQRPFQILGTHLQAGGPQSIRHSQYAELRALLDQYRKPGVPQIICGDMNTGDTDTANYADMLQTLDATDGPLNIRVDPFDEQSPRKGEGYPNDLHGNGVRSFRIIDYIFMRANGLEDIHVSRRYVAFRARWSAAHEDLSDHFGVGAMVYW